MAATTLNAQQTQALTAQLSALCEALKKLVAVEDGPADPPSAAPDAAASAKWAHIKLDWQRSEVMDAVFLCASSGHLDVIKYLVDVHGLNADDVRDGDNELLRCAAYAGHLDVIKYFVEVLGLNADDVRAMDGEAQDALQTAAGSGQLDVIKYFVEVHGLNGGDVRVMHNEALKMAARGGHLDVVKYLVEVAGTTKAEVERAKLLRCAADHPRVVEYLKDKFNVRPTMKVGEVAQRLVHLFGVELSP